MHGLFKTKQTELSKLIEQKQKLISNLENQILKNKLLLNESDDIDEETAEIEQELQDQGKKV
jgi:hypothetical protein